MPALIDSLLSTPDTVETVRDQLAAILKVEIRRQAELGLSPEPRVFSERSNPWGALVEDPKSESTVAPIVNVWFDSASFDGGASNTTERQKCDATFNVDVYTFASSRATPGGHAPGDEAASRRCLRTLAVCRQILMSAHYTYLALPRGIVWRRFPQTLSLFRPTTDDRAIENIVAGRLALVVSFNELAPGVSGPMLEGVSLGVSRAETGELYFSADYPPPPPPPP